MSTFRSRVRNELGRRVTEFGDIKAVRGYEPRRALEELLDLAGVEEGRVRENALSVLLRFRGTMSGEEHARYVSLVAQYGREGLREALLATDRLLVSPRLTVDERARLGG